MMRVRSRFGCLILVVFALMGGAASAESPQIGPVLPSDNAPKVPLIPYPGNSSPLSTAVMAEKADPSLATLAPAPTGASGLDEVEIAPRKTVVLSSQSSWEKGFESLSVAFRQLDEIVMGAGFDVVGRPFAVFTQTDDAYFHFDAMLPIATDETDAKAEEVLQQAAAEYASAEKEKPLPAVKFEQSPSGKAYRFVHAGPYDDIDTAYEAITTYLDNKDILVSDTFIEEYVTDLTKPDDAALEIYIYVQPKEPAKDGSAKEEAPQASAAEAVKETQQAAPDKDAAAKIDKPNEASPQKEMDPASSASPVASEPASEKPSPKDEGSKKAE